MLFRTGFVTILALAVAVTAAAQDSAPAPDPATLAPRDALAWVGVSDLSDLLEAYERTAGYRMMKDPVARKALIELGAISRVVESLHKRLATSLDMDPEQLKNPFDGPVSLCIRPPAEKDGMPRPVLAIGIGDRETLTGYYERLRGRLRERVDEYERISFDSFEIDSFRREPKDKSSGEESGDESARPDPNEVDPFSMDEDSMGKQLESFLDQVLSEDSIPPRLALCVSDRLLIAAGSVDEVKDVLRLQRGGGESLRDSEGYKVLLREFKQPGPLRLLVNVPALLDLARTEEDAREQMTALGLESFGCIVAQGTYGMPEYDQVVEAFVPISGERTGLAKIVSRPSTPIAPAGRVPADAFMHLRANLHPGELVDEIESITRRIDPEAADEMRNSLEAIPLSETESLNLRRDVINRLRDPLALTISFARPLNAESGRFLATIGHAGKDALVQAIEALRGMAAGMLIDRELRGTPVYDIPLGGVSIATTSDRVLFGVTPAVESELQEVDGGRGLAEDPQFQRALAAVDREAWAVIWVNTRPAFELALELAGRGDQPPPMNPLGFFTGAMAGSAGMIRPEAREDARALLRYQTAGLMTARTTPDGVYLRMVGLTPSP